MAFSVKNWKVTYSIDDRLEKAFGSLNFTQYIGNEVSEAIHVFEFQASDGGQSFRDSLPKIIEGLKKDPWTFTIEDLSGEEKVTHNHVVKDYDFDNTLFDHKSRARFTLRSAEMKALMDDEWQNESWETEGKMEQPVEELCSRHGLTLDKKEETEPVEEWKIIRQVNYTDLEFVRLFLCPRCKSSEGEGGYVLYTIDGKKAIFARSAHDAKDATPDPEQVISVKEHNRSLAATQKGGFQFDTGGINPFTKKEYFGEKEGDNPEHGNTGPSFEGKRYEYQPFWTDKASEAWRVAHQGEFSSDHYPFSVKLHGSSKVGSQKLEPPLIIDLSGSKFREPDSQKGTLIRIIHRIKGGKYVMELVCERHKINY